MQYNKTIVEPVHYVSYTEIGYANANGDIQLTDGVSSYPWIMLMGYASSVGFCDQLLIPSQLFATGELFSLSNYNGSTARDITVQMINDDTVTVSNRTSLNVYIYGVR